MLVKPLEAMIKSAASEATFRNITKGEINYDTAGTQTLALDQKTGKSTTTTTTGSKEIAVHFKRIKGAEEWRELFERNRPETLPVPSSGFLVNWLGVKTDIMLHSGYGGYEALSGRMFSDLPIPGDGHHVGADEYAGLLTSIENRAREDSLCILEIGAGWGPWISSGGIVAKRLGLKNIDLVGVEADARKFEYMKRHMEQNNLTSERGVDVNLILGAAWTSNSDIYFGASANFTDYAASATEKPEGVDYRGLDLLYEATRGYTLESIIGDREWVDFIAMDIQGAEYDILSTSIDTVNSKARFITVGTHSPSIHGNIIELMFNNGWQIIWDQYPQYEYDLSKPNMTGMTTSDGELLLANTKLLSASEG